MRAEYGQWLYRNLKSPDLPPAVQARANEYLTGFETGNNSLFSQEEFLSLAVNHASGLLLHSSIKEATQHIFTSSPVTELGVYGVYLSPENSLYEPLAGRMSSELAQLFPHQIINCYIAGHNGRYINPDDYELQKNAPIPQDLKTVWSRMFGPYFRWCLTDPTKGILFYVPPKLLENKAKVTSQELQCLLYLWKMGYTQASVYLVFGETMDQKNVP